eukprot:752535-Hanusia_phi.AAC.3
MVVIQTNRSLQNFPKYCLRGPEITFSNGYEIYTLLPCSTQAPLLFHSTCALGGRTLETLGCPHSANSCNLWKKNELDIKTCGIKAYLEHTMCCLRRQPSMFFSI